MRRTPEPDLLASAAVAFGCVAFITIIMTSVCVGTPLALTLGPLAGFVSALACRRPLAAAFAAPLGLLAGTVGFNLLTIVPAWDTTVLVPDRLGALGVGAVLAFVLAFAMKHQAGYAALFASAAVAILLLAMWLGAMTAAGAPYTQSGLTPAEVLRDTPDVSADLSDEGFYLLYIDGVRAGRGYYETARDVLIEMNRLRSPDLIDATSAAAYRLPTLYVMLAALPNNGVSYIALLLALGSAATVAAYTLCHRFLVEPLALVGASAVASFYAGWARGVTLLQSEAWAGGLVLLAVALLAGAVRAPGRRRLVLMGAAAVAALVATLFRELAIAAMLAGLGATLLDRETRAKRLWLPWLLAIAVAVVALAFHIFQVTQIVAALPADQANTGRDVASIGLWFHADGKQVYSTIWWIMWAWGLRWQFGAGLVGASIAGVAILLRRPRADRLMLAAVVIGGIVAIAVLRPPGEMRNGLVPYYWSGVIMPTVLACVPLVLVLVRGVRRAEAPAEPAILAENEHTQNDSVAT